MREIVACLWFMFSLAACQQVQRDVSEQAHVEAAASVDVRGESSPPPKAVDEVEPAVVRQVGDRKLSGPYTHDNLSVYLVHSKTSGDRKFITLDEGLKSGKVKISEKENAEVGQLTVENLAKVPLFLQEGDRLVGGKQDRMVYSSLVVPPHSGQRSVPSFCIEQSRWTMGQGGRAFANSESVALAPKSVRYAGKGSGSQAKVWKKVAKTKGAYSSNLGSKNTNSSLNEALDSPVARKAAKDYQDALGSIVGKHADVVGVVFVVGDSVEELDVYPGPSLFKKVYPRLLQSFAMDAAGTKAKTAKAPSAGAVKAFFGGEGKALRNETLDEHNKLDVVDLGSRLRLRTVYKGDLVHEQFMAKEEED